MFVGVALNSEVVLIFFLQCGSLSSSSFKNFHSVIHSGFRTSTGTKTTNMKNRNSLGLSQCFSCSSFACCCLASLSRNHIFDVLMGRRKCDQSVQKTLNIYRLISVKLLQNSSGLPYVKDRLLSCTTRTLERISKNPLVDKSITFNMVNSA